MRGKSKLVDVPKITVWDAIKHLIDYAYHGEIRLYNTYDKNTLQYKGKLYLKPVSKYHKMIFVSAYYRNDHVAIYYHPAKKPKKPVNLWPKDLLQ